MTEPLDYEAVRQQVNAVRSQTYDNMAVTQAHVAQAEDAAARASADRAAVAGLVQQTVTVDTSVGTRVMAGNVMIHGDTGWRNVESLLVNGWVKYVYPAKIRRIGNRCTLNAYLARTVGAGATSERFMESPPAGFQLPVQTQFGGSVLGSITSTAQVVRLTSTGFAIPNYLNIQPQMWVHIDWITDSPWPTSLPGTPA